MGVLLMVIGVVFLIFFLSISGSKKTKEKLESIDKMLVDMKNEILSVNGSSIPNKVIKNVFGVVKGISDQVSKKEEFELAEKEAMYKMLFEAQKLGANAVIDVNMNTGTYEQQGSKWQVTQIIYTATAVEIE
jgi:uncharacterized protein YbjQ (UPF0145 family)